MVAPGGTQRAQLSSLRVVPRNCWPIRRLSCLSRPSHITWEEFGVQFSRRGVRVSEKISEVRFLYVNPGRHAQAHTNHKPVFVELHVLSRFRFFGQINKRVEAREQLHG